MINFKILEIRSFYRFLKIIALINVIDTIF